MEDWAIDMDVLNESVVTDAGAKKILEDRKKEVEELKYEQKNALDILKKFVKTDSKEIEELVNELKGLGKLRDRQIISIVNALPQDADELRGIMQKEYSSLTKEETDLILQAVKKVS
jgi:DNA-directed RNA polymerase subunit F